MTEEQNIIYDRDLSEEEREIALAKHIEEKSKSFKYPISEIIKIQEALQPLGYVIESFSKEDTYKCTINLNSIHSSVAMKCPVNEFIINKII